MSAQGAMPQVEISFVTQPKRGWAVLVDGRIEGPVSMNRDVVVCRARGVEERLRRKGGGRLPCMTCRQEFDSEGPHNRMCDACRRRGDGGAMI